MCIKHRMYLTHCQLYTMLHSINTPLNTRQRPNKTCNHGEYCHKTKQALFRKTGEFQVLTAHQHGVYTAHKKLQAEWNRSSSYNNMS